MLLGKLAPELFHAVGDAKLQEVKLPVAALIWLMLAPMLLKVDFTAIGDGGATQERLCRDAVHPLTGQALLHGAAGHAAGGPRRLTAKLKRIGRPVS